MTSPLNKPWQCSESGHLSAHGNISEPSFSEREGLKKRWHFNNSQYGWGRSHTFISGNPKEHLVVYKYVCSIGIHPSWMEWWKGFTAEHPERWSWWLWVFCVAVKILISPTDIPLPSSPAQLHQCFSLACYISSPPRVVHSEDGESLYFCIPNT